MGTAADFTQEGLGYEHRPLSMTIINHIEEKEQITELKSFFASIWNDPKRVEEVTEQVAAQIETLYRENPPEFIYFLTLYHLFRDFMEDNEV